MLDYGVLSESTARHLQVFYTGLYRVLMFPRRIDEVDSNGQVVHYSPYDPHGGVHAGPLVTDNGLWDTFRTVYPLLSLAYPDHLGTIVQGIDCCRMYCMFDEMFVRRVAECVQGRRLVAVMGKSRLSQLHGGHLRRRHHCRCDCERYQGL